MQSLVFIAALLSIVRPTNSNNWNYRDLGPDVWSDTYSSCARSSQSPINIRTACTTYQPFIPFNFSLDYDLINNFTLTNNGHTIIGTYTGSNPSSLTVTGGGLNGTFQFVNFHLHWGENYKSGSEHQVNGMKYTGEIHFVHTNPQTNKFAVLSIFMQSGESTNTNQTTTPEIKKRTYKNDDSTIDEWKKYFVKAENLQEANDSDVVNLSLATLMGIHLDEFWRYEGSLTTPPCTEGIIWTLFKTPTLFTENELGGFRKNIFFEDFRGPQPLNNRAVYRNFRNATLSSISDYNCFLKNLDDLNNSASRLLNHSSFSLDFIQQLKYLSFLIIVLLR